MNLCITMSNVYFVYQSLGGLFCFDFLFFLLSGFEKFVHPHHKKQFKEMLGDLKG